MSAAHEIRHEPFWDDRLRRFENKVVEMARNGLTLDEIADELDWETASVRSTLCHARKIVGVDVAPYLPRPPRRGAVPISELVALRASLQRHGIAKRSIHRVMAERLGMSVGAIKVRLWTHDHKQKGASP